jgi:hypothetical protein
MARADLRTCIDRFASTPTGIYSEEAEEVEMLVKKKVAELKAKKSL